MTICALVPPADWRRTAPPANLALDDHGPQTPASKRLRFRAWHRGTREADLLIGGFFDR